MKYKTSELEGALLDAAVAKAEGLPGRIVTWCGRPTFQANSGDHLFYSSVWNDGGPIIERERIGVLPATKQVKGDRNYQRRTGRHFMDEHDGWVAGYEPITHIEFDWGGLSEFGETPLIAAMRAFVASKLGDEVEF